MHEAHYIASIEYDEFDQSSYRGITLSIASDVVSFNTGCPVIDYINMLRWAGAQEPVLGIVWSSSYNHFLMDGDVYCERYVSYNGNEENPDHWVYVDPKLTNYDFGILTRSEFKSFQEHRAYYKECKQTSHGH